MPKFSRSRSLEVPTISPNWAPRLGDVLRFEYEILNFSLASSAREVTILVALGGGCGGGTCTKKTQRFAPQSSIIIASQPHAKALFTFGDASEQYQVDLKHGEKY